MLCTEWSLVKHNLGLLEVTPLYCKRWSCMLCQPKRKSRLIREVKAGNPNTFITLTVSPKEDETPAERCSALSKAWRTVVARAKRKYKIKKLPYFVVVEATKAGEPHLHILARLKWIDQRWLSDQMRALTGAPIVDIRRIRHRNVAAAYVAKYIGKAPGKFGTSKRYWQSKGYRLDAKEEKPIDRWTGAEYWIERQWLSKVGIMYEELGRNVVWDYNVLVISPYDYKGYS